MRFEEVLACVTSLCGGYAYTCMLALIFRDKIQESYKALSYDSVCSFEVMPEVEHLDVL